ncbi:hypothetical protein GOP47_0025220 [Adiantum capillus-veneris]|uniref:non-specific serine/threonine protein kinase n=1 Tax=Adiantum capillus-veneris TaxID=13818 RepID=A0A9D4U3Q9_ADICA|nr:hypothetical protein GOP47_0025220 [Adiantum capillus-veneris]
MGSQSIWPSVLILSPLFSLYNFLSMKLSPTSSLPLQPIIVACLSLSQLIIIQASASTSFIFNWFDGKNNISLSGVAEVDRLLIKLTNINSHGSFGRAFYPHPIRIKDPSTNVVSSFSTTFVFCISPMLPTLGGHGLAFVMSPSLDTTGISVIQYLGMLNQNHNGNSSNHVFGVEFDTVQNIDIEDINDNHVGINLNSVISTNSTAAGYWITPSQNSTQDSSKTDINLKGSENIQAWIEYDGQSQQLNVTIAPVQQPRPYIPLLSVYVNLSAVLREYMFVGFSSSTGALVGTHRVLSWSFNSNGVAKSLDLSKLPSVFPKPSIAGSTKFKVIVSIVTVVSLLVLGSLVGLLLHKRSPREIVERWELEFGLHRYSYKDLVIATRNFDEKELLGIGGFGRVYRGVLPHSGLEVAVKRLSRESNQGEREFIAEIVSTGHLRHRNLVHLLGWSRCRGELLLVYDYMPNGSLDKLLFGKPRKLLRWEQRMKIVSGVAAGMLYLHEGWEQQIIHRDIKASNVLLDADMNGKLGDFGLARLYEHGQNPHTTRVVGTLGYLAPEFAKAGKATPSTDVYSFGVLLLEVVTGRRSIEHWPAVEQDFLLVDGVWDLYAHGRLLEAVDKRLDGFFNVEEVQKVLMLGLLCSHRNPVARPAMRQVVQILSNEAPLPPFHIQHQLISEIGDGELISESGDGELISFSSSSMKSFSAR